LITADKQRLPSAYKRFTLDVNILITGASGTGTTTLGRALASDLSCQFFDTDDYYWLPSNPSFQQKQEPSTRVSALLQDLNATSTAVIAGSVMNWGSELEDSLALIVFLTLPKDIRIARLEEREVRMRGAANPDFLAWARQYEEGKMSGRSRARHEQWLSARTCPVVRIDGDTSTTEPLGRVRAALAGTF
jgi:adenylate kinase family enzyme